MLFTSLLTSLLMSELFSQLMTLLTFRLETSGHTLAAFSLSGSSFLVAGGRFGLRGPSQRGGVVDSLTLDHGTEGAFQGLADGGRRFRQIRMGRVKEPLCERGIKKNT